MRIVLNVNYILRLCWLGGNAIFFEIKDLENVKSMTLQVDNKMLNEKTDKFLKSPCHRSRWNRIRKQSFQATYRPNVFLEDFDFQ